MIGQYPFLRIFSYVSFRVVGAAATALVLSFVLGPIILRALRRQALHQVVREGTPDTHLVKATTPTMGGLIILTSSLLSVAMWGRFSIAHPYILIALFATVWMGAIGFIDDVLKIKQKREGVKNSGLIERPSLIGHVTAGVALSIYILKHQMASTLPAASASLPFFKSYYVYFIPIFGVAIGYLF